MNERAVPRQPRKSTNIVALVLFAVVGIPAQVASTLIHAVAKFCELLDLWPLRVLLARLMLRFVADDETGKSFRAQIATNMKGGLKVERMCAACTFERYYQPGDKDKDELLKLVVHAHHVEGKLPDFKHGASDEELVKINDDELAELVRASGETPSLRVIAAASGDEIVFAVCPVCLFPATCFRLAEKSPGPALYTCLPCSTSRNIALHTDASYLWDKMVSEAEVLRRERCGG